jgi:hypothetical protein
MTARFTWYEVERNFPETGWVRDEHERYDRQAAAEIAAVRHGGRARVVRVIQEREVVRVLPLTDLVP